MGYVTAETIQHSDGSSHTRVTKRCDGPGCTSTVTTDEIIDDPTEFGEKIHALYFWALDVGFGDNPIVFADVERPGTLREALATVIAALRAS